MRGGITLRQGFENGGGRVNRDQVKAEPDDYRVRVACFVICLVTRLNFHTGLQSLTPPSSPKKFVAVSIIGGERLEIGTVSTMWYWCKLVRSANLQAWEYTAVTVK